MVIWWSGPVAESHALQLPGVMMPLAYELKQLEERDMTAAPRVYTYCMTSSSLESTYPLSSYPSLSTGSMAATPFASMTLRSHGVVAMV